MSSRHNDRVRRRRLSGFKGDLISSPRGRMQGRLRTPASNKSGRSGASSSIGTNDDLAERRATARSRLTSINRTGRLRTPKRSASRGRSATPFLQSGKYGPEVDDVEVARRYRQIMDIFAKGKINQKNAWGLKLMENIERMIEVAGQGNFKKCSATIAAATTIYKHRVDDVYKNTFRMLSNFSVGDLEGGVAVGKKKPQRRDNVNTLLTADQCQMNYRSVVSEVDPMFHKTTSAFDEGGSHGLLLNNLRVQNGVNVVFDSSTLLAETLIPEPKTMLERMEEASQAAASQADQDMADPSQAPNPKIEAPPPPLPSIPEFETQTQTQCFTQMVPKVHEQPRMQPMCPGLEALIGEIHKVEEVGKRLGVEEPDESEQNEVGPKKLNFVDMNETMDFASCADPDKFFGRHSGDMEEAEANERALQAEFSQMGHTFAFDDDLADNDHELPRFYNGGDFDLFRADDPRRQEGSGEPDNEQLFFDPNLKQNWSGPESWILRRQRLRRRLRMLQKRASQEGLEQKPKRKNNDLMNFAAVLDGVVIPNDQFIAPKKPASTMLSVTTLEKRRLNDNTLPEDLFVMPKILTSLFLKPKLHVGRKFREQIDQELKSASTSFCNPGELDESDFGGAGMDENYDDLPPTQQDQDPQANTQLQWMKCRGLELETATINFAKSAKKVNIKRLKESIFRHIKRKCIEPVEAPPSVEAANSALGSEPSPKTEHVPIALPVGPGQPDQDVKTYPDSTSFSAVLRSVSRDPRQKNNDVSIHFAFMGLLHLANVKNLRFSPTPGVKFGSDFTIQVDVSPEQAG